MEIKNNRDFLTRMNERRLPPEDTRAIPVYKTIPEHPGVDLPPKPFTEKISSPEFYAELTAYASQFLGVSEGQLFSGIRVQDKRNLHWFKYFKPAETWIDVVTDYNDGGGTTGSTNSVINADNDYPLPIGKYYSATPTTDPDAVFVLDVIPTVRYLPAQVIAFRGKDKGYLIQNDLSITELGKYTDTAYWHEVASWYYVDWSGGSANPDIMDILDGGDALGTGLQSISGGHAA